MVKPVRIQQLFEALSQLKNKKTPPLSVPPKPPVYTQKISGESTILIVEDNPINLFLLKTILFNTLPNVTIIEAQNGNIALAEIDKKVPTMVFMDVQMPELNGYQTAEAIRSQNLSFPIVALTAGTIMGERERCLAAGMDDYITKPVLKETIDAMLEKWLTTPEIETKTDVILHFNRKELEERMNNQLPLVEKILLMADKSIAEIAADLQQNTTTQDWALLTANAHKLKGVALSISLPILAKQAAQLEHLSTFDTENIQQLVHKIQSEVTLCREIFVL